MDIIIEILNVILDSTKRWLRTEYTKKAVAKDDRIIVKWYLRLN